MMLTADMMERTECTIHVQLLLDSAMTEGWKAAYLKEGKAKKPKGEESKMEDEESKGVAAGVTTGKTVMEIEDDEVIMTTNEQVECEATAARGAVEAEVKVGAKRQAADGLPAVVMANGAGEAQKRPRTSE